MDISARIEGITYRPFLCRKLEKFHFGELENALSSHGAFLLVVNRENEVAVSWWVSAKRTRSYPYARVYDTLGFSGKKITIIPIMKDEGVEGDRDFLQWDTISLMSLLGIYVIIAYYDNAKQSKRYTDKITDQRFNIHPIRKQIEEILSYQSDALHWNLAHIDQVGQIGQKALTAYVDISKRLKVRMHSKRSAEKRITELLKSKKDFMRLSRMLAERAQKRERATIQPKEKLSGTKAIITIRNYLGGYYFFTSDETGIRGNTLFLIEGKHSVKKRLPSSEDIKDGLLKMILFTNLKDTKIEGKRYNPVAVLKLTTSRKNNQRDLTPSQKETIAFLRKEAEINNFKIIL